MKLWVWNQYSIHRLLSTIFIVIMMQGCASTQIYSNAKHQSLALLSGDLEKHGLAFLIPSTVTGKEEDKQVLALVFTEALSRLRPDIRSISLPQSLSIINNAGLSQEYKQMVIDYQDTGIFSKDILSRIGATTGARYLAQLKLSDFVQYSQGRFSALGLRLFQTKQAHIRVFFQIWDSETGSIVWEGVEELNYAYETSAEEPVSFNVVVNQAAENLIQHIP